MYYSNNTCICFLVKEGTDIECLRSFPISAQTVIWLVPSTVFRDIFKEVWLMVREYMVE